MPDPSTNGFFFDLSEAVFLALAQARKAATEVRGSMFWRDLKGTRTLISAVLHRVGRSRLARMVKPRNKC